MKDLINTQYCNWLKRYRSHTKHQQTLKAADELIHNIPTALTPAALLDLITRYTSATPSPATDTLPKVLYGPIEFYTTLLAWQKQLKTLQNLQQNAFIQIRSIKPNSYLPIPVLTTLHDLNSEPLVILHTEGSKLLCLLNHNSFPEIIKRLTSLEIEEPITSSKFHFNKQYCHNLLIALHAQPQESDKVWHLTSQLLELIKSLYHEHNALVEIDLDYEEPEEAPKKQQEEKPCVIL